MFANLMKGSPVFVLDTRDTPKYYMITLDEAPRPYFPMAGQYPPQQPCVTFPVGGQDWVVPVNADVASRDKITLTTSRERLFDAATAKRQHSQDIVNSYDKEKNNLEAYDQIMRDLSPTYATQAQRDEEIISLRKDVQDIQRAQVDTLASVKEMFDNFIKSQAQTKTSK